MLINSVKTYAFTPFYTTVKSRAYLEKPDTLKPGKDTLRKSIDTLAVGGEEDAIGSVVDYTADDSIKIEAENKKAYLYGNATVHYEDFDLKAAYIEIDNKTNLITAVGMPDSAGNIKGSPQFKQGKEEMRCEKIIYNVKTKKGKIFGILTKQNDMFIFGEAVKKDTNNVMYIKRMKCIPCEFEDAMIYFRASKAKVIPNDKIVTGPLFLEVSNIPTPLGLPFGFFPNVKREKSKMGILMPSYGYSATQGFYLLNMGYFIPVSNKLHVSLYGSVYGNGSWAIGSTVAPMFQYKVNYKYSGNFNVVVSQNTSGILEDNPKFGLPRDQNALNKVYNARVTWSHTQDSKYDPTIRFSATVNAGTAGFGRYNNQSASTYLNSILQSNIAFTKMFRKSTLSLNISDVQNLQSHSVQIDAPSLTYAVNRMFPFKNEAHTTQNWLDKFYIDYTLQSKATVNTIDSLLFKQAGLNAIQYGLFQSVPIGTNISLLKYFTLSPQATFKQYTNFQTTETVWDNVANKDVSFVRRSPSFAFDQNYQVNLTTKIYGDYVFKSKLLKQIRHQIIPTVGFVYHPDMQNPNLGFYQQVQNGIDSSEKTHPTATYNYFSRYANGLFGGPAGPQSGAITFNINNTLDAKVRQKTDTSITYKKVAILQMLSLGGSYDLAAKQNNLSIINLSARTSFFKNVIGVTFVSAFDPYGVTSTGTRSTKFEYDSTGKIARLTSCNFAVNGNLTNAQIKGLQNSKQPFSIGLTYNLQFQRTYTVQTVANDLTPNLATSFTPAQTLGATFSVKPTPMWKFDIRSGYDFKQNAISYTQFTIYRDLRCWEARITWVPFGPTKQYMLTLNLKSPTLSTLKIPKQKLWQDNL